MVRRRVKVMVRVTVGITGRVRASGCGALFGSFQDSSVASLTVLPVRLWVALRLGLQR